MYISDRKTLEIISLIFLVLGPVLATAFGLWSWIIELMLLSAVVYTGRGRGVKFTAFLLLAGYLATTLIYGYDGVKQMGLVPWAGFIMLKGWEYHWKPKTITFWGLVASGFLAAFPAMLMALPGIQTVELQNQLVNSTLQMYKESGMMTTFQQSGISEAELTKSLRVIIQYYLLLVPSLLALGGLFEFVTVNLIFSRRIPLSRWQLPWYAVWGAILGIASYLLGDLFKVSVLETFGMNLMVLYAVVGFFLGISLAWSFLKSPKVPRVTKYLAVAGGFIFMHIIAFLLIIFALFDLVLNFRKLPDDSQEV